MKTATAKPRITTSEPSLYGLTDEIDFGLDRPHYEPLPKVEKEERPQGRTKQENEFFVQIASWIVAAIVLYGGIYWLGRFFTWLAEK